MKALKFGLGSLILSALCFHNSLAQTILTDYKGNLLFQIPTTFTTPEFSLSNIGVNFRIHAFKTYQYYVPAKNSQPRYNTMVKSHELFGGAKFFNDNEDENLIVSRKTHSSPYAEFGYTSTIDELQNPNRKKGTYYTMTIAVLSKLQRLNTYDKSMPNPESVVSRISPGLRGAVNIFKADLYAIAINGSYKREIPTDKLTSYQNVTPDFFSDGNVASNGDIDGYLAPVAARHRLRGSIAVPIFWEAGFKNFQLVPTPYYSIMYSHFDGSTHNGGVGLSLLNKRIYSRDRSKDRKSLKLADLSTVSVGYNIINSSDKSNARFFFLSGSIKLGDLLASTDKPEKQ